VEEDKHAGGKDPDADPLPAAEAFSEPADGTEDDENGGELDDDLGGGGRGEAEPEQEAEVVASKAEEGEREKPPAVVGELGAAGEIALPTEEETKAGGGDEVADPGDRDGVNLFGHGAEGDRQTAPQGGREEREHKAHGRKHYFLV
jgi:hypothetical protein